MTNMFIRLVQKGWLTLLWLVGWIVYAQFLWGFIGLGVVGIVGPLLIPFLIVPQLDWLFWSWLRACFQITIYMMTAGVIYVVVAMIMIVPLSALGAERVLVEERTLGDFFLFLFGSTIPYLPFVVISLAGAAKVGAISTSFVGGGSMPAAGIASRVWAGTTAVGTKAGRQALGNSFHGAVDPVKASTYRQYRRSRYAGYVSGQQRVRRQAEGKARKVLDDHESRRGGGDSES